MSEPKRTSTSETYLCSEGETFDGIALLLYGSERYAADLLCANPEHCHLLRMRGGETLRVPAIQTPSAVDDTGAGVVTPPWKV